MSHPTVNEASTAYLAVAFYDKAGSLDTPASVSYRIDDVDSGDPVKGDTPIGAASSIEITLSPADNAMVDSTKRFEMRRVTVEATYGVSDKVQDEYLYKVKNLRKA